VKAKRQLCPARFWQGGAAAPPQLRLSDYFWAQLKLKNEVKVVNIWRAFKAM